MKILIIGFGSIGSFFASILSKMGVELEIIKSKNSSPNDMNTTINFKHLDGKIEEIDNLQFVDPGFYQNHEIPQIVLISTKTYDLNFVCEKYHLILCKVKCIILIQNGLGNEEIIQKYFRDPLLFRLITSNGAIIENNLVIHTGKGQTILCNMNKTSMNELINDNPFLDNFIQIMHKFEFGFEISKKPLETIWKKALINIGINAFGALTHHKNGSLLSIPDMPELMNAALNEAKKVANRLQIPLDESFNYEKALFDVCIKTSQNKNSMLQDVEKKRKTEIDFLNKKIVEYGKLLQIETPINACISVLIHGLELSYSKTICDERRLRT